MNLNTVVKAESLDTVAEKLTILKCKLQMVIEILKKEKIEKIQNQVKIPKFVGRQWWTIDVATRRWQVCCWLF